MTPENLGSFEYEGKTVSFVPLQTYGKFSRYKCFWGEECVGTVVQDPVGEAPFVWTHEGLGCLYVAPEDVGLALAAYRHGQILDEMYGWKTTKEIVPVPHELREKYSALCAKKYAEVQVRKQLENAVKEEQKRLKKLRKKARKAAARG